MSSLCRTVLHLARAKISHGLVTGNLRQFKFSTGSFLAARKYTDKHEWVDLNGNVGTVGISDYAQAALGDIVYAQLPDIGSEHAQMDECGALESVKAASELFCPVSGKVVEKNIEVEGKPGLINTDCYATGWLFKMELSKPEEMKELMDETAYAAFLKSSSQE